MHLRSVERRGDSSRARRAPIPAACWDHSERIPAAVESATRVPAEASVRAYASRDCVPIGLRRSKSYAQGYEASSALFSSHAALARAAQGDPQRRDRSGVLVRAAVWFHKPWLLMFDALRLPYLTNVWPSVILSHKIGLAHPAEVPLGVPEAASFAPPRSELSGFAWATQASEVSFPRRVTLPCSRILQGLTALF